MVPGCSKNGPTAFFHRYPQDVSGSFKIGRGSPRPKAYVQVRSGKRKEVKEPYLAMSGRVLLGVETGVAERRDEA